MSWYLQKDSTIVGLDWKLIIKDGDGGNNFQLPISDGDIFKRLQASSVTYRFSTGPRKGRKAIVLKSVADADVDHNSGSGLVVKNLGFSLHAGVAAKATERDKLERIARYVARPAVSEERLSTNAAGDVIYRFKKPWDDGTAVLKMAPLEFMERLAALVPRPRIHLTRYSGVLAPHYKYRRDIVPKPKAVPPRKQRMHWARLLKRVFGIDVETCPCCQGRVRIIAAIEDKPVIKKILEHLGLPTVPPRIHPARGPPPTRLGARSLTSSHRACHQITTLSSPRHSRTDCFSSIGRALPKASQILGKTQKMNRILAWDVGNSAEFQARVAQPTSKLARWYLVASADMAFICPIPRQGQAKLPCRRSRERTRRSRAGL